MKKCKILKYFPYFFYNLEASIPTFRGLIHVELIFITCERWGSNVIAIDVSVKFSSGTHFPMCYLIAFVDDHWLQVHRVTITAPSLFHWSMELHHDVSIAVDWHIFHSGTVSPVFIFFPQCILAIQDILWFYTNFGSICCTFLKNGSLNVLWSRLLWFMNRMPSHVCLLQCLWLIIYSFIINIINLFS